MAWSVRSGDVVLHITAGTFGLAGHYGIYWSSRGGASTTAYYLQIEPSAVKPSLGPYHRYSGFPLRCLVLCRGGVPIFW